MRIFFGVDLPLEVKDYLYELENSLKDLSIAKIQWVPKRNFHLTLKFLGEISEEKVKIIKLALKDINLSKFRLRLGDFGYFPGGDRINILCVGLENDEPLRELQKLIDEKTIGLGDLKLGSHITLGRVKFFKKKKEFLEKINKLDIRNLEFEVGSFCLFESRLSKDGPRYYILEKYKL